MCREAGERHPRQSSSGSEAGASSPRKILAVAALVLKWEVSGWCRMGGTGSEAGLSLAGRDEGKEEAELSGIS